MRSTTLIGVLTLTAACHGKESAEQQTMSHMDTMAGMAGMTMRSDSLMPIMRAHLDSLAGMPAQFAAGMLIAHEAMASQMLDAMGADMRMMNLAPDTTWNALADSIRRDLADLPSLSGRPLEVRPGARRAHAAPARHARADDADATMNAVSRRRPSGLASDARIAFVHAEGARRCSA